jgi:hypothetical protein
VKINLFIKRRVGEQLSRNGDFQKMGVSEKKWFMLRR